MKFKDINRNSKKAVLKLMDGEPLVIEEGDIKDTGLAHSAELAGEYVLETIQLKDYTCPCDGCAFEDVEPLVELSAYKLCNLCMRADSITLSVNHVFHILKKKDQ